MPLQSLIGNTDPSDKVQKCFVCELDHLAGRLAGEPRDGTNIIFYDCSVGRRFAEGHEPRICDPHKEALRGQPDRDRAKVFAGFPLEPVESAATN